jgi:sugar phosphate isomerase/epimerase
MVASTALGTRAALGQSDRDPNRAIRYCLNTSTIRGHKRSLAEEIDLVSKAGYDGIEPWIGELEAYRESGASLHELQQRLSDTNLRVESAIGFAQWIVDDDAQRRAGLETLKRDMDLVRQLGGTRIAAPPAGATDQSDLDLDRAAERYAAVLEIGREMEVTPQLEVWGFSKALGRLCDVIYVAVAAGHEDACLLPDVYHLFKGGSDFRSLSLIGGSAVHVMHLNDYPDSTPREAMQDRDRVYPGDGAAPLGDIIGQLQANGFRGVFSLELFNPAYWEQPIEEVLATGLAKMKAAVNTA